jgi:hypothetical protein
MFGRPGGFRGDQFKVECNRDPARNLVLQGEQIARVAVEALRPEMRIGLGVDQLGVHADPVVSPPDAAFQYVAHTKLAPDLPCVDPFVPVGERVLREITSIPASRDRSVVRSSVIPSAKYCCSLSSLRLANGRTTIDSVAQRRAANLKW